MRDARGRVVGAAVLIAVLAAIWSGLYADNRPAALAALAVAGAAPVAAAWGLRRRLAVAGVAALSLLVVAAVATHQNPFALITLEDGAWQRVREIARQGVVEANTSVAPITFDRSPAFMGLLDVLLAAQAAVVAGALWLGRRPVVGVAVALGAVAYRWTVAPPTHPVRDSLILLAACGVALYAVREAPRAGLRARGPRGVVVVAAVAVVGALVGIRLAEDARPWWNWRAWGIEGTRTQTVGQLEVTQRYGQLEWPDTPRVVMTVDTPRPVSLRAASLPFFDGNAFDQARDEVGLPVPVIGGEASLDTVVDGDPPPIQQLIDLKGSVTTLLFHGGRALRVGGALPARVEMRPSNAVAVTPAIGPDVSYAALVVVPDPDPARLRRARIYDAGAVPTGTTDIIPYGGTEAQSVPLWPAGPKADIPATALGDYAEVRQLAQRVVGDAATPYVAVNRIEAYLRDTANYRYVEKPPQPTDRSPISTFLFQSREGFCQHFAGSMALMLRSVGIPSRVVVGYTKGTFDAKLNRWVVVDRDAHSWVEAYLPDAGWVEFDPTPGRYVANRVSVGSPDYDPPPSTGDDATDVRPQPVEVPTDAQPTRPESPTPDPTPAETPATAEAQGETGVPWWVWALGGGCVLLVAGVVAAPLRRAWRHRRARRAGDERTRTLAAVAAFEQDLDRLGVRPPRHLDAAQRARHLQHRTGVDASGLYHLAERARYGRADRDAPTSAEAWRQARALGGAIRPRLSRRTRVRAWLGVAAPTDPDRRRRVIRRTRPRPPTGEG